MISLRRKVDPLGRIVQDTGSGGAWPVSTDRMVWLLAAWEVYIPEPLRPGAAGSVPDARSFPERACRGHDRRKETFPAAGRSDSATR